LAQSVVATAILGEVAKIQYVPLQPSARLPRFQSGGSNVLCRIVWTFSPEHQDGCSSRA